MWTDVTDSDFSVLDGQQSPSTSADSNFSVLDVTCDSVAEAAAYFEQHGFAVLSPALAAINPAHLATLRAWCASMVPVPSKYRDEPYREPPLRWTMNDQKNSATPVWLDAAANICGEGLAVARTLDAIVSKFDPYKRWY